MLLDMLHTAAQWLAAALRRTEISRLMRRHPPRRRRAFAWVALAGAVAVAAIVVPFTRRYVEMRREVDDGLTRCHFTHEIPAVVELSVVSTPPRAYAVLAWRDGGHAACVTPCTLEVLGGAKVHVGVTAPGRKAYETVLIADAAQTVEAKLPR